MGLSPSAFGLVVFVLFFFKSGLQEVVPVNSYIKQQFIILTTSNDKHMITYMYDLYVDLVYSLLSVSMFTVLEAHCIVRVEALTANGSGPATEPLGYIPRRELHATASPDCRWGGAHGGSMARQS